MLSRTTLLLLSLAVTPGPLARAAPSRPPNLKLKPGAAGTVCLECHGDFEERLKKAFVHTPVKARNCVGCHNPHTSEHGKLLAAEPGAICASCHSGIVPKAPKSSHKPVAERRCADCHDPHGSAFKFNLAKAGNDLCAGCHAKVAQKATSVKYKHRPVEQGCVECHDPHGSARAASLLKNDVPGLCAGCHDTDKPVFTKQHMGYPVGKARCTSCHDPHGSEARGMLYDTVHPPVAKGLCTMCHEPPSASSKFKTRQAGVNLCRGCHGKKLNEIFDRNRVHEPVAEGTCLACHAPHASPQKGLVKGNLTTVCGTCHADTIRRQELSPTKHDPIRDGSCVKCHDPHSSDIPLMFVSANGIELCGTCHDWQKHSSHPIGETKKDPRNANLTLQCVSCHRAHGTEFKHMVPYVKTSDLCTKCHEQFKR